MTLGHPTGCCGSRSCGRWKISCKNHVQKIFCSGRPDGQLGWKNCGRRCCARRNRQRRCSGRRKNPIFRSKSFGTRLLSRRNSCRRKYCDSAKPSFRDGSCCCPASGYGPKAMPTASRSRCCGKNCCEWQRRKIACLHCCSGKRRLTSFRRKICVKPHCPRRSFCWKKSRYFEWSWFHGRCLNVLPANKNPRGMQSWPMPPSMRLQFEECFSYL